MLKESGEDSARYISLTHLESKNFSRSPPSIDLFSKIVSHGYPSTREAKKVNIKLSNLYSGRHTRQRTGNEYGLAIQQCLSQNFPICENRKKKKLRI